MCIEIQVNNTMFNTYNNNNLYVIWFLIYNISNQTKLWLFRINVVINLIFD